jgi:hypothetical protein
VARTYEHNNEISGSIKSENFLKTVQILVSEEEGLCSIYSSYFGSYFCITLVVASCESNQQ